MAKYVLAGSPFKSKEEICKHYRAVRDSAHLHEEITDPIVIALYQQHPDWDQKTQDSSTLWIDWHQHLDFAPTKQIMIKRPGKESLDISYKVALDTFTKSKNREPQQVLLNEFRRAARCEIEYQIDWVRSPGLVVDHVYPFTFEVLLRNWVKKQGFKVKDIAVRSIDGQKSEWKFADCAHAKSWQNFHEHHAKLEAITKEEHYARKHIKVDWTELI